MFKFVTKLFKGKEINKENMELEKDMVLENEEIPVEYEDCSYKKEASVKSDEVKSVDSLQCQNCHKDLKGIESARDGNLYYISCSHCSFVNRILGEQAYATDGDYNEMMDAYELFKKAKQAPKQYSIHGEDKINADELQDINEI